jgi:tetratricopeptide (TPR) repeat protein
VIERYGITHFDPNLDGEAAGRLVGRGPAVGAALVGELVDHLSFRHNPRMASLLGWLLSRGAGGVPPDQQLELLSRCSQWNGQEPALLFATGTARYQLGERAAAREALRLALAADRSAPWARAARLTLAYLVLDEGRPNAAVQRFEKLVIEQRDDPEALYGLALALERAGDPNRAIECWQGYLRMAPPGPWREKAQARLERLVASPDQ